MFGQAFGLVDSAAQGGDGLAGRIHLGDHRGDIGFEILQLLDPLAQRTPGGLGRLTAPLPRHRTILDLREHVVQHLAFGGQPVPAPVSSAPESRHQSNISSISCQAHPCGGFTET